MSLKDDIKDLLSYQPWLSSSEMADIFGKDRNNVRAAAKELVRDGELTGRNDGGTFRFYPVDNVRVERSVSQNAGFHLSGDKVIDADFYETQPSPSQSHAVAVYGASQPADNRRHPSMLAGAVGVRDTRQNGRSPLSPQFVRELNAAFLDDGEDALTKIASAVAANTAAIQHAERRAVQLYTDQENRRREEAAEREKKEQAQRREEENHRAIMKVLNWTAGGADRVSTTSAHTPDQHSGQIVTARNPVTNYAPVDDDARDMTDDPDPADFDDYTLAEIDDRARQRVRAEPVEQIEDDHDDDGRVVDPNKLWQRRPTFSERLAAVRREEAKAVVKEKAAAEMTRDWFLRASQKTKPASISDNEPSTRSQTPNKFWGRVWRHLATPSKSEWR